MSRRLLALSMVVVAVLAAVPAQAETFHIKLTNGTSFDSRYQPMQAPWDENKVVVVTDLGNRISLAKTDLAEITSSSELRGFGEVINNTTIEMGVSPNDEPEEEEGAAQQREPVGALQEFLTRSYDQEQFVEPDEVGGGIPVFGIGSAASGNLGESPQGGGGQP